jgi:hypothetical protein
MAHGSWSEVEARELLDAWRRGGPTLSSFARQRGLVVQRLRWWKERLDGRTSSRSLAGARAAINGNAAWARRLARRSGASSA